MDLHKYGQELVAAGFEVWFTRTNYREGGYLQYRNPETGCCGSLEHSDHEGWLHLMPIVPSREYGSSMHIGEPLPVWTVEAARQCAQPFNRNDVVGRQANARDKTWRSTSAIALHTVAEDNR
jgi:hypothetical protein